VNILLISPSNEHEIRTSLSFVDDEVGITPPLGLLYVAAYAEANTEHNIDVLDAQVEGIDYDTLKTKIAELKPDIVGIHAMSFTMVDVLLTAKTTKEVDNDIKVIVGGVHPSIYPEETLALPYIDHVIVNEGEVAFTQFIQSKPIKQNGYIRDLDSLPFPARHLTPYKRYRSLLSKGTYTTNIITSRGCPYQCIFCNRPQMGKRFRARSPQNVVDELEECVNLGIREFLFYDDTFTVDEERVIDICDEILDRKLDIIWSIRTRVDNVSIEMLEKLKRAGCIRIHYGIEAGNQTILNNLKKGITIEQVKDTFSMTKKVGIDTLAYFMMGSPGETRKEVLETIEFACRLNPNYAYFSILTPYPATELYSLGISRGLFTDKWQEFATNPTVDFMPDMWEEYLSREELNDLINYAYREFYIRPKFVFREVVGVRSASEFYRKAKAGIEVFRRAK